ncbi:MAG: hypothetical protein QW728_08095 [Thermoplasmata archaeon]
MARKKTSLSAGEKLLELYTLMYNKNGYLNWWPGEGVLEISLGAILTQQTSWTNVEKAISNLKSKNMLNIESIVGSDPETLALLIRPSGYYNQKAKRLKEFCAFVYYNFGNIENFLSQDTENLRHLLLSLKGIGPETADSIILYAAGKPSFVVDAYTFRILERTGVYPEELVEHGKTRAELPANILKRDYEALKSYFEKNLPKDVKLYNDFHAQFVITGKNWCNKKPVCSGCPLENLCLYRTSIR